MMKRLQTEKKVFRKIKVTNPKIIPLATEEIDIENAKIHAKNGKTLDVRGGDLTNDMREFLVNELGATIESVPGVGRKGRTEIQGVRVKVTPIKSGNYSSGANITIREVDELSYINTDKINTLLVNNGIDLKRDCVFVREELACNVKM